MLQRARGRHEIAIAMASKNGHQGVMRSHPALTWNSNPFAVLLYFESIINTVVSSPLICFRSLCFSIFFQNNEREVGELVLDYHYASLEVQTDIDNAYSLLCVAQDVSLS